MLQSKLFSDEFSFLQESGPVLLLDIGSGTQDVLLALPNTTPENWPQFILPAPSRMIRQKIQTLTEAGKGIWLYGHNTGGGFFKAVHDHLKAGYTFSCTAEAAAAIHDDLDRVQAFGIEICPTPPHGAVPVYVADYDSNIWENILRQWALPLPYTVVAAVQDHGVHEVGNRFGRMQAWRDLLEKSSHPEQWLYTHVAEQCPSYTRLATLQSLTGGPVADTGTAAVLGALCMPEVWARSQREGVTIINVGNSHTIAMLVYQGEVMGIYEHHTGQRCLEELLHDLQEFRLGWLPDEAVRATGGHGTVFSNRDADAGSFAPTFILGPQRELLRGHGQFIAPHGQMMLAGCFGLLRALGEQYIK